MTTPYQMCINNVARIIRRSREDGATDIPPDAFECSVVLAMAFCKSKEDVLVDILSVPHFGA